MFIYPYKMASEGAKNLRTAIGAKLIKREGSKFKGSAAKTVINWGNSELPEEVMKCNVINKPDAVAIAANKKKFFDKVEDYDSVDEPLFVRIPPYTTDIEVAKAWLDRGETVVERHKLTGNSGDGIKIKAQGDELEPCPLYVLYIKKKSEWRIHVAGGEAVDIQRKARRHDVADEDVNWKVRNHANGFIFARNDGEEAPEQVIEQAVNAVKMCGLDFGAVDVIYNAKYELAYVLEVNTAPGLTGTTLEGYAERLGGL